MEKTTTLHPIAVRAGAKQGVRRGAAFKKTKNKIMALVVVKDPSRRLVQMYNKGMREATVLRKIIPEEAAETKDKVETKPPTFFKEKKAWVKVAERK
jgi:hypothetical protein